MSVFFFPRSLHLWSAKDSPFSGFSVPAEANMMVVSRSAMMPDTALAAVIQAWVPLFPACRAESTKDTWNTRHAEASFKREVVRGERVSPRLYKPGTHFLLFD